MSDLISRQQAINALWKALYKYEDETEKQFQESDELDVADWIVHRIFVQNMSDIDRQIILDLPSAQPEIIQCRECKFASGDSRICVKFDHSPIDELDFCAWGERRTDG